MNTEITTEVLVCGGGPCGLMLANELGRRGVSCLVVDRKPATAFNPQANATQARTMEHFRRLGFAHKVRAMGLPGDHPTDIAYFTRYGGHELTRLSLPTADASAEVIKSLSGSWSAAELPHRVSQKYVEATMLEEARRLPGVELRYGWEMQDFADQGDGIAASIAPGVGGAPVRVQARYLMAADGARSMVRQRFGIPWEGATGIKRKFMGGRMFAVYLRAPDFYRLTPHPRAWMYVLVNASLRGFLVSVDGAGEFAFHVQLPDGEDGDHLGEADARRFFAEACGQDMPVEILSTGTWLAGHALVASELQRGRVFLGGDAAHLFTPTGGLGYNTAVEDAVNLGWKLAAVLRGQAPASLLDSYALERKPVAVRNTGYARGFADSVGLFEAAPELEQNTPDGLVARALASDYLNGHVRREFNIPGVTFGGRYDASPIIAGDGSQAPADAANSYEPSACPGGRPPHAWLDDGRSLYDSFHFDWTLLVLGVDAPDVTLFEQAARTHGISLAVVRHQAPGLCVLYGAPLALIRPDHIVAWRGHNDSAARAVLAQVLGHGIQTGV